MTPTTRRQGQSWGQFPAKWRKLIAAGDLSDANTVRAVQAALKAGPPASELVAPSAKDSLFLPTIKIEALGGTLDDLLTMLLETIENLAHPLNRNFAAQTTALKQVDHSLDFYLQTIARDDAQRGRKLRTTLPSLGGKAKAKKARDRAPAKSWLLEVENRRSGLSKEDMYRRIGKRELIEASSVKRAVLRQKHTSPTK